MVTEEIRRTSLNALTGSAYNIITKKSSYNYSWQNNFVAALHFIIFKHSKQEQILTKLFQERDRIPDNPVSEPVQVDTRNHIIVVNSTDRFQQTAYAIWKAFVHTQVPFNARESIKLRESQLYHL